MGGFTARQGPDENLDYELDWSQWLPQGDTITSSTWTSDEGLTLGDSLYTTTNTTIWVSGGALGESLQALNTIGTAQGRIAEQTLLFRITKQ
jgi:hypothetical protein